MNWLLVFLGGGLGSLARYGLARWVGSPVLREGHFPLGTLLANFLACLVLGVGLALAARGQLSRPAQLLFLTGFCGGFSTFSTFGAEIAQLGHHGHHGAWLLYLLASLLSGVAVIYLLVVLFVGGR